jgi:hypothetical protein
MQDELGPLLGAGEVDFLVASIYIASIFARPARDDDFGESALVFLDFAEALGGELGVGLAARGIFRDAFVARGIIDRFENPIARIIPLELLARETYSQLMFGQAALQGDEDDLVPAAIPFSVTLAPNERFDARIELLNVATGGPLDAKLFLREGQPVEFQIVGEELEVIADDSFDGPESFFIENGDAPRTFFLAFASQDAADGFARVSEVEITELAPPGVGCAAGGCAVSRGSSPISGALPILLFALGLAALRRRPRRG